MSWLQDAEVTLPKTPAELLAEAQSAKIVEINAAYTAIAEPIVRDYPEVETKSWDQQKADAEAYLAWHEDQEGEPPTLLVLPGILRGRNGTDGTEGAVTGHVIGSYLHGPILPANPRLADTLIGWAAELATGRDFAPEQLDDEVARQAQSRQVRRLVG